MNASPYNKRNDPVQWSEDRNSSPELHSPLSARNSVDASLRPEMKYYVLFLSLLGWVPFL